MQLCASLLCCLTVPLLCLSRERETCGGACIRRTPTASHAVHDIVFENVTFAMKMFYYAIQTSLTPLATFHCVSKDAFWRSRICADPRTSLTRAFSLPSCTSGVPHCPQQYCQREEGAGAGRNHGEKKTRTKNYEKKKSEKPRNVQK